MGLSKIRKQFFIFNFFGRHLSLRQVCFFETRIKFLIFYILYDLFQDKKFHLLEGTILNLSTQKPKKIETPQNKEKCLF